MAVTDFSATHLAAISNLESLDLGDTNVTDRGVAELAKVKQLRSIDLHGTRVTGKGLASLAVLPALTSVKLWKCRGVDDSAAEALLKLEHLQTLEIPETSFTGGGLMRLAQHKQLKQLLIGGLALTADELAALKAAMPNCQVSWWAKPAIEYPDSGRRFGN